MVRTVKVRLELDRDDYRRGLRDAASDTRTFDGEVRSAGKDVGAMGVEVKSTGAQVESMGRQVDTAAKTTRTLGDEVDKTKGKTTGLGQESDKTRSKIVDLAKDIDTAKASLKALGDEFQRTGQIDLSKLDQASRTLRDLERAKADLDKLTSSNSSNSSDKSGGLFGSLFRSIPNNEIRAAGTEAGKTFASGVEGSLATPILGPVLIGTLVAAAVAAAPFFGAVLAGGVMGAAGLGAIGTGIALQLDRVKPAAVDLAQYLKNQLTDATASFGPAASRGLNALKREMAPFWNDIRQGLNSLTPYVSNLLVRLGEGLAKLGPGLGRALEAAGPILGAISKNIPTLLNGINIFFDEISKGGKGAAEGIDALMKVISGAIAALGFLFRGLANLYDTAVQGSDKLAGAADKLAPLLGPVATKAIGEYHNYIHGVATSFDESKLSAEGAAGGLDQFASAASSATGDASGLATATQNMNTSMSTSIANMTGLDGAAVSMKGSIQSLKDSIAQNGKSLDINTAAGRSNVEAMLAGVQSAEALRKAQIDSGLSAAYADDQYRQNVESLRQVMLNAGMNKDAVDRMIQKYLEVPGQVTTNVALNGVVDAITKGETLQQILNNLDGKVSRAAVVTTYRTIYQEQHYPGIEQGTSHPLPGVVPNRWGGVYTHAAVGVLRDAAVYSAASPARYAYAEPSTGGEAFVPRYGNYGRSMSILDHAASWYGARVVPGGMGGAANVNVTLATNGGTTSADRALAGLVAYAIRSGALMLKVDGDGNVRVR